MFKRYIHQGGVCDPMVIHWPAGIKAKGEVRHQYHHSTDAHPTTLEACSVEMPEHAAAHMHGISYKILADIAFTKDAQSVIFAQGSRFRGRALFVKDSALTDIYNVLGIPPESRFTAPALVTGEHMAGVELTEERMAEYNESHGALKLPIDEQVAAEGELRTMTGHFSRAGEGLCISYDSGDAISSEYKPKHAFAGGTIAKVVADVADDANIDVELHFAAAMMRD